MVQSMKKTLKAILKDRRVHEDVLHTALVEVEAILNSRPLTNDQDGPYDLEPFNPNHLIRHHNRSVPVMRETHESDVSTRKKWCQSQWLAEHFWKRFRREYMPTLTVSKLTVSSFSSVSSGGMFASNERLNAFVTVCT